MLRCNVKASDSSVFTHQMPGGQYTNLLFQSQQLGLGTQWLAVKTAYAEANELCGDIRPYAFDLVDAFGIPDPVLAAPIGLPGGEASRTSAMTIDDPDKNVRDLLDEPVASPPAG